VISISGISGTGKTTLAEYLVGNFLTATKPYQDSCIWIQTSESFPNKRLVKLFQDYHEKLDYIKNNIFITPPERVCASFDEQKGVLERIYKENSIIPPNLKFIVIDNISNHLRYEISKFNEIEKITSILDQFFNAHLFPLIMFCQREGIKLILIHEISYNPNLDQNKVFFHKLYERINSLDIILRKNFFTKENTIEISYKEYFWSFNYSLHNNGFNWKMK
jgi:RecA/RadA recombinase